MTAQRHQLSAYSALYALAENAAIDRANGVIRGVSVITEGAALGHDAFVDSITLDQVVKCAAEYKNGVRVNNDHGSDLYAAAGFLREFRIEKREGTNRVVADLHILESETNRDKLMELAATIPDTFGLSVVISGQHEKRDGKVFLRCDELLSTDLVPEPAANPTGLFSRPKHQKENPMAEYNEEELNSKISAAVAEVVEERMTSLETSLSELRQLMEPAKTDEELAKEKELAEEKELSRIRETAKAVASEMVGALSLAKGPSASPAPDPAPAETFEDKAVAFQKEGKSKGEAISLAARQNPTLHQNYLARLKTGDVKPIAV